ncbi:hypothetical protein [Streptomyces griseus]
MSDDQPVVLEGIPVFTGDLALLDSTVKELTKDGAKIATAAGDIHSSFGGLQAFYQAPEADQLFATTKPVADRGAALKSDLATITGALSAYSDEAHPLVEKLRQLKRDAGAFLVKVNADDKWREDGDLVEENNHRRDEIRETWAEFQAVERACYNKIIAMVPGGKPLTTNDGSNGKHMYGYDAEALKQAKGLPWGDPVKESTRWYQFYEHVWDFGKGFVVDGVWGTVKGLGTLFGTEGWDTAKQAWTGLGNLATGVILTVAAPHVLWLTPEKDLPGFARDARNAMKETGKALIAYDQWGENPARAGGAVTFNALTTIFTGGAGGGVSGAGKAAAAAKALSFANKASRVVDPTTYLFKGAGAGMSKISDVMAGIKGMGRVEVPTLPPGAITLPDGAFKLGDGTLHLPEGTAVPEGAFEIPKGSVKLPDGAKIPTGAVDLGDGVYHLPEGVTPPAGSLPIQEGALKLPEGTTALPEGTFRGVDADGNVVHLDRQGNILGEDGTLKQHHTAAQRENPTDGASARTDADSPLPRTPAEQSALVGAGARGGSDTVRLGSDLGDAGRVGDDLGRTGDDASNLNRSPGGTAHNLPTNSVDNSTPGGGPRGGQGDHVPANSLGEDNPTATGGHSDSAEPPSGDGGGHGDLPDNGSGYPERQPGVTLERNRIGQQPSGPMMPGQEAAVAAALKDLKVPPVDQGRMLTQLKKSEYGAAVADYISSGRFADTPGFKNSEGVLFQVKQKGMMPAAHQAMEHAAELQARGMKGIEFEVKLPGENLDLDVLIRNDGHIDYAAQLKDVESIRGIKSAVKKISNKQLLGALDEAGLPTTPIGVKAGILDIRALMSEVTERDIQAVQRAADRCNASFELKFDDGSITVYPTNAIEP